VRGDLPFEQLEGQFSLATAEHMPTCNFLIGKGRWQLSEQRCEEAIETLEQALKRAIKNFMVNFHTVAALIWLVTALRIRADELRQEDVQQSRRLQKRGLRLARRAAWITRIFPGDRPHALRELGLAYAAKGRAKKALKLLDKSCAVAKKQKAPYEFAQSLSERANLAQQQNAPRRTGNWNKQKRSWRSLRR